MRWRRTAKSFQKMEIDLTKETAKYPSQHLPLQNVNNEGELQVVEDMVDLPFLHEVSKELLKDYYCCYHHGTVGKQYIAETRHMLNLISISFSLPYFFSFTTTGRHFIQYQSSTRRIVTIHTNWRYYFGLQPLPMVPWLVQWTRPKSLLPSIGMECSYDNKQLQRRHSRYFHPKESTCNRHHTVQNIGHSQWSTNNVSSSRLRNKLFGVQGIVARRRGSIDSRFGRVGCG